MSTKVIAALIIGALSTITATAYAAVEHAAVTGGKVQGVVTGEIASFKGIPFAAPPVGANRWRSPQPVVPWSGVKPANAIPNLRQLQALDTYFAWRREQSRRTKH